MSKAGFIYEIKNVLPDTNNFNVSNYDSIFINDANNGQYPSHQIIFNSSSVIGSEPGKGILLSESTLQIPFSWTVECLNGEFVRTPREIYACCLKNHYSLVDRVFVGLGSSPDLSNSASYFRNLYINENMKRRTKQENELLSGISTCEFDNDKSLIVYQNNATPANVTFRGELNNNAGNYIDEIEITKEFINKAIVKRNIDRFLFVDRGNAYNYQKFGDSLVDSNLTVPVMTETEIVQSYTPYYKRTNTQITFYDVITLRLADLFDYFKQSNFPLGQLTGFTLRIVLNNGISTVKYPADNSFVTRDDDFEYAKLFPVSENYQSLSGFTCPWLLSSVAIAGNNKIDFGSDGIMIDQAVNGTGVSLKVTGKVGWDSTNSFPCRITIPQIKLNPNLATELFSTKKIKTILYNDFLIDEIKNVAGNRNINHEIGLTLQRCRRLYIIPFLANTNNSNYAGTVKMISPYQSCLTSAGVTCSKLMIKDLQVRVGSTNVYPNDPLKYSWQFYDSQKFLDLNEDSGNSSNSAAFKGLISKSQFANAYGVYTVDISQSAYQSGAGGDDEAKRISITCTCAGNPNLNYDFVLLLEYQKQFTINTATCAIEKAPVLASV